jgi:peptidoglycan/LPS O-acetylase OafA/YrhL
MIDATWSLAVEEQFYLTLPFIIFYVKNKYLPYIFLAGILLAPIIRILLFFYIGANQSAVANYVLAPCRMDALFLGALAAWFVRTSEGMTILYKYRPYLTGMFVVLFIGFLYLAKLRLNFNEFLLISIGYTWIALFFLSILLIAITHPQNIISRICRIRFLMFLGILAYGVYLFHQPVLGLTHGAIRFASPIIINSSALSVTFLAGCILLAISYLSWIYFEKPLVKLGHRYKYTGEKSF